MGIAAGEAEKERAAWLSLLAQSPVADLEALFATLGTPADAAVIRQAEAGLIMVRGRIGEGGQRFNLGETTVARCVVRGADGTIGIGYVQGRDRRHAELIARLDLLFQQAPNARSHLAPLAERRAALRAGVAAKAEATKVEFFTLVRGEP